MKIKKLPPSLMTALFAANGSKVSVVGSVEAELSLRIGDEEKSTDCTLLVVQDLALPMIIGSDVCSLFQIGVFCPDELVFRDSPRVTLNAIINNQYNKTEMKLAKSQKGPDNGQRQRGAVKLTEAVIVPPHAKICAPATLDGLQCDQEVEIGPFNNGTHNVIIAKSICRTVQGRGIVNIMNPTNRKFKLDNKIRIATWEKYEGSRSMV